MPIEAVRIALRHMTPVILLSDGYLANAAEPWRIPDTGTLARIEVNAPRTAAGDRSAQEVVFERDPETLGRPWVTPGTRELMHRIGGLEKDIRTGHISYEPANHQAMTEMRAAKVASVARFVPPQDVELGPTQGELAVVGWGSTYGAIHQAVRTVLEEDPRVSHIHLRHLNPFPANLGELLTRFEQILVPEMNMGQLATLLRDKLAAQPVQLNKVSGQPFLVAELLAAIRARLRGRPVLRSAPPRLARGDKA
jgi:2-oxoglutarate ferredoxin oxidoreductase subunit alpha